MARLISREFNPSVPVVVRRFFVAAGRHWNPGDPFDWPRLSIAQRRVKQLFDAGKLMHPAEGTAPTAKGAEEVAPPKPEVVLEQHNDPAPKGETFAADVEPQPVDELDGLTMPELRAIAEAEGAPSRVSRAAQREAIRENRKVKGGNYVG